MDLRTPPPPVPDTGPSGRGIRTAVVATAVLLPVAAAGCVGAASVLDPAGTPSDFLAVFAWILIAVGGLVLLIVTGFLLWPLLPVGRAGAGGPSDERAERGIRRFLIGGTALTGLVLLAVFGLSLFDLAALSSPPDRADLTIEVVGHRWWWEVRYPSVGGPTPAVTANEIHVPVGRTVRIRVSAADVIHSFWVPRLGGKIDLIPGKPATTWLRADEPGVYHGQCAEYCGMQHANMMLQVVARPPAEFRDWLARQAEPAPEPATELQRRGRSALLASACVECHTIRGTVLARGETGPDLTHVGSRRRIAAGLLPNERGFLEAWIANPQTLKPGNLMPNATEFDGETLRAVAAYLESLR